MTSSCLPSPGIRAARAPQRGNTLLTVLVLLLVMTLLALASLRMGSLEERMTANLFDRGLAFQAAEAALREGEALVMSLSTPPAAGSECVEGICGRPTEPLTQEQLDLQFDGKGKARVAKPMSDNTLAVPRPGDVRILVIHQGTAEAIYGCSRVLGADGQPKDPLCRVAVYQVNVRYRAEKDPGQRATVLLRSVVHSPSVSPPSP